MRFLRTEERYADLLSQLSIRYTIRSVPVTGSSISAYHSKTNGKTRTREAGSKNRTGAE